MRSFPRSTYVRINIAFESALSTMPREQSAQALYYYKSVYFTLSYYLTNLFLRHHDEQREKARIRMQNLRKRYYVLDVCSHLIYLQTLQEGRRRKGCADTAPNITHSDYTYTNHRSYFECSHCNILHQCQLKCYTCHHTLRTNQLTQNVR